MEISIFKKYRVKHSCESSFISQYSCCDDYEYETYNIEEDLELSGYKVMGLISEAMVKSDTISIDFTDNIITIVEFDPSTGEGADHRFIINEILSEEK